MKKEHKTIRFDYSKIESKADFQYWGIHPTKGRLHIDTKRYKKICEHEGMTEHMPEGMFQNRHTPYFIPAKKKRYDYKYNIFRDLILSLKKDWFNEYKPCFERIKTPNEVYEQSRLGMLAYTACSDDYDNIDIEARWNGFRRESKYIEVINSLYFQFIQKICVEVNRYLLIVCKELGYKGNDFNLDKFYTFSDGIINDKSQPKIETFKGYNAFNLLNKTNNFLKHNSVVAYQKLKRYYPKNIAYHKDIKYENGMYAGDWIKLKDNYIDEIFDKLIIFFGEYCKNILGEKIQEAEWNYDDYFRDAFKLFQYPLEYWGIP